MSAKSSVFVTYDSFISPVSFIMLESTCDISFSLLIYTGIVYPRRYYKEITWLMTIKIRTLFSWSER